MGYLVRLGKIAKSEHIKYQGKTFDECTAIIGDNECLYRLPEHKELYDIGKTTAFESHHLVDFYSFDIYDLTESDFRILPREGLLHIIEMYRAEISAYYSEMYKEFGKACEENDGEGDLTIPRELAGQLASALRMKHVGWANPHCPIANVDDEVKPSVSSSWQMEYAIFNLVHLLKTFDWENDYMIYSGW